MDCDICQKSFSSISSLNFHKKTAKYCLEKQGKTNDKFKCEYCDKIFTTVQRLTEHINQTCKIYRKIIDEQQLKEKESYHEMILKEKNEYITKLEANIIKLEAKLEKFENAVVTNMVATTHTMWFTPGKPALRHLSLIIS